LTPSDGQTATLTTIFHLIIAKTNSYRHTHSHSLTHTQRTPPTSSNTYIHTTHWASLFYYCLPYTRHIVLHVSHALTVSFCPIELIHT